MVDFIFSIFKERWVMDGDISYIRVFFCFGKRYCTLYHDLVDFSDFSCFGYDPGRPTQFQHTRENRGQPGTMYKSQTT